MQKNSSKSVLDDGCVIRVAGKDALSFLQGQLSCDLNSLNEQQSSLGCCCDRKGRVLFSFRIFIKQEAYYLYLPRVIASFALEHLTKYIIIAKVHLQIEECLSLGLSGNAIKNFLNEQFAHVPEHFGEVYQHSTETLICVDQQSPRYLLITDQTEAYQLLDNKTLSDWHYAELQQGWVNIYPETQGLFIPQMLNYEKFGAISFTKGCFVGQEIIARTQHLGKLKRHLHRIDVQHEVKLAEEIMHEDKKGIVAAVALNPQGNYSALVVLQD